MTLEVYVAPYFKLKSSPYFSFNVAPYFKLKKLVFFNLISDRFLNNAWKSGAPFIEISLPP
jgi:hypothetical protein